MKINCKYLLNFYSCQELFEGKYRSLIVNTVISIRSFLFFFFTGASALPILVEIKHRHVLYFRMIKFPAIGMLSKENHSWLFFVYSACVYFTTRLDVFQRMYTVSFIHSKIQWTWLVLSWSQKYNSQSIICGTSRRATIYCVNAERVWLSVISRWDREKK